MGKLLSLFYLFVGIFCSVSVVVSFYNGHHVLGTWLIVAALGNFLLLQLIWNEEKKRRTTPVGINESKA
ncbi:hypothetical protein [Bacillus kwashiorkori]|uniref:hypothetical protein n=1 Tax=Bacillus kwashiorkori TaxID=1522318 RepID=UPI000780D0F3|nr:hypothetical protein [Bacillus kwashiorkori]